MTGRETHSGAAVPCRTEERFLAFEIIRVVFLIPASNTLSACWIASWQIRIRSSSRKSTTSRRAFCSGLQRSSPTTLSCTHSRSTVWPASFAVVGQRPDDLPRPGLPTPGIASGSPPVALRPSSRLIVDGDRPSRRLGTQAERFLPPELPLRLPRKPRSSASRHHTPPCGDTSTPAVTEMPALNARKQQDIAVVFKAARERAGLSQAELAEGLAFPRDCLADLESRRGNTYTSRLFRVLPERGITVTLIYGDDRGSTRPVPAWVPRRLGRAKHPRPEYEPLTDRALSAKLTRALQESGQGIRRQPFHAARLPTQSARCPDRRAVGQPSRPGARDLDPSAADSRAPPPVP